MRTTGIFFVVSVLCGAIAVVGAQAPKSGSAATGSITGRVKLTGKAPGNPLIRMGMDPKCAQATKGKQIFQMSVVTNLNGDLANAFVSLKGAFPKSAVPAEPVTIDQKDCMFVPRVAGARVGQTLLIKSSDNLGHNSHAQSTRSNIFNLMQPNAQAVSRFVLKDEEVMLKITCDLHRWMFGYVGVVNHPYFAVTAANGTFTIDKVPAGNHTIQVWHERYGPLTKTITVAAGKATSVDFAYTGTEPAPRK